MRFEMYTCKLICRKISLLVGILLLTSEFCFGFTKLTQSGKISLLTCSSGDELYSLFGHSALRVVDDSLDIDVVFNYGTFDFETPYFALKFMNGDLNYMLSYTSYSRFKASYIRDNRSVVESELLLSTNERDQFWQYIVNNARPENREYRYDFFFDNCATRIRDILFEVKKTDASSFSAIDTCSFRDYIHSHIDKSTWTAQGIDLLLGIKTDRMVTMCERAFLPMYLDTLLTDAKVLGEKQVVVESVLKGSSDRTYVGPTAMSFVLMMLTIIVSIVELKKRTYYRGFDYVLMGACSLLSLLMWYLWLFTKHDVCSWNMNVLWASWLYIPMLVFKKSEHVISIVNCAILMLFVLLSTIGVQAVPTLSYFIVVSLFVRNILIAYRHNENSI